RLMVFASASLLQGQLSRGMPDELAQWFPGFETDAQRALQFVRSTPGITCALVGMSRPEHVEENLATASVAPLDVNGFRTLFARAKTASRPSRDSGFGAHVFSVQDRGAAVLGVGARPDPPRSRSPELAGPRIDLDDHE